MSDPENEESTYDYYYDYNYSFATPTSHNITVKNHGHVFLPTLYSVVFILGIIGNSMVVCVLVKHRKQTTLTDVCLLNLAVSDLLFVLSLPFYAHYVTAYQWIFGDFMCRFVNACYILGFYSSIFFMVIMTVDRYVLIMHVHTAARHRTVGKGIVLSVSLWVLSLCVSLPNLLFTHLKKNDDSVLTCSFNPESNIWHEYNILTMNILGLVVPLLVMVLCYSRIVPTLMKIRSSKKHRVIKMISLIVVIFVLFWTPYNVVMFLDFLKKRGRLDDDHDLVFAIQLTESIALSHSCLNPIIYAFTGQKFLRRVLFMLKNWVPWCFYFSSQDITESSVRRGSRSSFATSTIVM